MQVIEYFTDDNNYIKGWQMHNVEKKPNLINNQMPLPEMNTTKTDSKGRLYVNNIIFKLDNGRIITESYIDNGIVGFRDKYTKEQVYRLLALGVENKSNPEFLQYLADIKSVEADIISQGKK